MSLMQQRVSEFVKKTPITLNVWKDVAGSYYDQAVQKAQTSIIKTYAELAKRWPGNASYTIMAVNNDRMPLLELLAESFDPSLRIPAEGEFCELRFEGVVEGRNVRAKLVYAAHGMLA
jgi:hypothetical protein